MGVAQGTACMLCLCKDNLMLARAAAVPQSVLLLLLLLLLMPAHPHHAAVHQPAI
jgi:hypothetical protein